MDKRVVGTLLGIAGLLLWFMPWMAFSMGDMDFHQTGSHIGGIAYVLLMSSLASAILSWVPQPVPRIIVAAQNTMMVAAGAVLFSAIVGSALGLVAGYAGPRTSQVIMRLADVIMSFPSLLIAVIVLYILGPSVVNLIIVLAITRIPVYLRTTRAEVLEIKSRMFVSAARVMGASPARIIFRHILPVVLPTLMTIATLDFAFVMLAESALSFLGIGIQPPEITWGLMISQGKQYLTTAW